MQAKQTSAAGTDAKKQLTAKKATTAKKAATAKNTTIPTQMLMDEHQKILTVSHALQDEADAVESRKKLDRRFFEQAIDFIQNYADKFHHAKEEDILFKELCRPTVQLHCNPVEVMLHEHNLGRSYVKGLIDGLKSNNKKKIAENARGYAMLIQDHIYKEDNILYPMAEEALNSAVQKRMLRKFIEVGKKFDDKKYLKSAAEFEKKL